MVATNKKTLPITYIVKPGDTLYEIAQNHYGSASSTILLRIYEANKVLLVKHPNNLYPGMELTLPPLDM